MGVLTTNNASPAPARIEKVAPRFRLIEKQIDLNSLITLGNPNTINEDWQKAGELWRIKYNRNDPALWQELAQMNQGNALVNFLTYWRRQNNRSYIDWVFPCAAPARLSIRAYLYHEAQPLLYLIYDRATKKLCVDGSGTPYTLMPLDRLSVPDPLQRGK